MKWFIAANDKGFNSPDFVKQIRVAVYTARIYTTLEPWLLYDGDPADLPPFIRDYGVNVLRHELSFKEQIRQYVESQFDSALANVRTGAYLRSELPGAIRRAGIRDTHVLYTDCDVMFCETFTVPELYPRVLAAWGSKMGGRTFLKIGAWKHFNSGVLVMNVDRMLERQDRFKQFVLNNGNGQARPNSPFMRKNLFLSDQVAMNLFYKGEIDVLPQHYNWHPSAGINERAMVVHFNGLKWTQWDAFQERRLRADRQSKFERIVQRAPKAFEYYVLMAGSHYEDSSLYRDA